MVRRLLVTAVASGAVFGFAGCRHKCCSAGTSTIAPAPFLPGAPPNTIPPAGVPVMPPGGSIGPAGGTLPPPDLGPTMPPATPSPAPPPGGREPLLPDPIPGGGTSSRSLSPGKPGILGGPVKGPAGQTREPPKANKVLLPPTGAPAGAVAGVPGFTKIKDGVATGRRPALDGFDALKRAGYSTAIYLHPTGADVASVRAVAEQRGLTFRAVETTPETLPVAAEAVNAAVAGRSAKPVYVFDDDGVRAGAVWYAHFRAVDLESAEVAEIRARGIGLAGNGEEVRAFRAAIEQYLATK